MPADVPDEFRDAALSMLQLRAYQEACEVLKQPEQHQRERLEQVPVRSGALCGMRRCGACNAPRKGDACWKCGAETFVPHADWEEPGLPSVDRIRELAREVGYAIGEHGSKERDLDLIAAPWAEDAVGNYDLIQHIAKGLGARVAEYESKPLGRCACTIQMDGWYKALDLSVCPKVAHE